MTSSQENSKVFIDPENGVEESKKDMPDEDIMKPVDIIKLFQNVFSNDEGTDRILFGSNTEELKRCNKSTHYTIQTSITREDAEEYRKLLLRPDNWLVLQSMRNSDTVFVRITTEVRRSRLNYDFDFSWEDDIECKFLIKRHMKYIRMRHKTATPRQLLKWYFYGIIPLLFIMFIVLLITLVDPRPNSYFLEAKNCVIFQNFVNSTCG